ncbi:23952_t:CDS:2, partial [Racocetra persica]
GSIGTLVGSLTSLKNILHNKESNTNEKEFDEATIKNSILNNKKSLEKDTKEYPSPLNFVTAIVNNLQEKKEFGKWGLKRISMTKREIEDINKLLFGLSIHIDEDSDEQITEITADEQIMEIT